MFKQFVALLFLSVLLAGCNQRETSGENPHSSLPSLYISIPQNQYDSILLDSDYKASSEAVVIAEDGDTLYFGSLKHIKTRGNSTFTQGKKPYSIKFPKAQKLFNLHKSKSFVLLANWYDESHMRNAIGLDISEGIGLQTPRYVHVSLYINDEYKGSYLLTNKVEINKHTLNIADLEKQNKLLNPLPLHEYAWEAHGTRKHIDQRKGYLLEKSPDDISGGYLLEIAGWKERYDRKDCGFQANSGDLINIREPKYASHPEVEYIANYYNAMEQALFDSTGYNPLTKRHYSEYLDIHSFALSYIVNELLMNLDAGITSFYMYKDVDDKIYAGPSWDFDRTLDDNFWGGKYNSTNQIWAGSETGDMGFKSSGGIFYQLLKHEDFRLAVCEEWNNNASLVCHEFLNNRTWDSLASYISNDVERDNLINRTRQSADYLAAVDKPLYFLRERVAFLDWFWNVDETEIICVSNCIADGSYGAHDRLLHFYYKVGEPIIYPLIIPHEGEVYNHDPIQTFYIAGKDSIVPNGSILDYPAQLEMRWREPSWKEVQLRRIKKKLHKIFW